MRPASSIRTRRLVAVGVAAVLLAGCGASVPTSPTHAGQTGSPLATMAVIAAASAPPATAAPRPTASPRPTGTPLPTPGVAAGGAAFPTGRFSSSDQAVDLLPTGDAYIAEQFATAHDAYAVSGDQVSFKGESCGGASGTYRWAMSGSTLVLTKLADPCLDRLGRLVMPLTRAARQLPYVVIVRNSGALDQPDFGLSAVDPSGTFWETDGGSGLYHYAADGSVLGSWTSLTYAVGVAADAAGNIYVSNFDDATIHVYDASGNELRHWGVAGGHVGPVGLALDPAGNLYVALHRVQAHYVEKYSPSGALLATLIPNGSGPGEATGGSGSGPEDVAVDRSGDVWLTDPANSRLVEVDAHGRPLRTLTGDGAGSRIVAVDAGGDVYTMDQRVLWEFSPTGKVLGSWFSPYEANVVIDDAGHVFLVDQHITEITLPRS